MTRKRTADMNLSGCPIYCESAVSAIYWNERVCFACCVSANFREIDSKTESAQTYRCKRLYAGIGDILRDN